MDITTRSEFSGTSHPTWILDDLSRSGITPEASAAGISPVALGQLRELGGFDPRAACQCHPTDDGMSSANTHDCMPDAGGSGALPRQVCVSMYERHTAKVNTPVELDTVLTDIRAGRWRDQVEAVRTAYAESGKAAAKAPKDQLPCVTFSGVFNGPHKAEHLQEHTGLVVLDYDDLGANLAAARAMFATDQHTRAMFTSPTGTGIKVLVGVGNDPALHGRHFDAVSLHFKNRHGLMADPSGRDVSRLCYVSYDPELYLNPGAVPFAMPGPRQTPVPASKHGDPDEGLSWFDAEVRPRMVVAGLAPGAPVACTGEDGVPGYRIPCLCPWRDQHTDGNGAAAVFVYGMNPVGFHCFHGHCADRGGQALYREIGFVGADNIIPLPSNTTPITESARGIFPLLAERRAAFWRGGRVCEVITDGGQTGISPIPPEAFRSRIEQLGTVGTWIKSDNGKRAFSPKRASKEDCVALLATREAADLLPPIEAVFAAPVLLEDAGAVHRLGRGYHKVGGGCMVTGGGALAEAMPLGEAAALLKGLLLDFQFATPSDFSRALAFLVTPCLVFGRFLRGPCPIFVAEADQSQTGKGYFCEAVCRLYGEDASIVAQRNGGVGGFDESVQERLVLGQPFIFIDNLRGHVDSQFLEAVLTARGRIGCRIPHRGEIHVDTRRFLFFATSNGIKSTTDFANRACIIRLRKQPTGYVWHVWPEGGLWEHIEANAARYQSAVHTIVEAWYKAGAPRKSGMTHAFHDWAGALAAIVSMIWQDAAPLLEGHREAQERTANPALSWLREVAIAVTREGRCGEEFSATAIAGLCAEHNVEIPGLRDGTDAEKAAKLVGYNLRRCLGDSESVTVEGHTVCVAEVSIKRDDGNGSFAAKRYTFIHPGDHSNHSKAPITPKTFGDSLISYTPLLGVTVDSLLPPSPELAF